MTDSQAQKMFDAGVRVESMFWIAGICAQPPREFEDFLEEDLPECDEILAKLPWLKALSDDCAAAEDVLSDFAFRRVDGFFVQLATPKPRDFFEGGYSCGWGMYRTKWFFFHSLDEVVTTAVEWQKSVETTERQKAAALSDKDDITP